LVAVELLVLLVQPFFKPLSAYRARQAECAGALAAVTPADFDSAAVRTPVVKAQPAE